MAVEYFLASEPSNRIGKSARPRQRRRVDEIYKILGPTYFRRAYRMTYKSFCSLHDKLEAGINHALARRNSTEGKKPPIPNGPISTRVRLACALRYFAGGSPYDIMVKYGISHTEIFRSVWCVVDAINRVEEFFIVYPDEHEKQRRIAAGFQAVSQAGFDNCAGAIDGILIWIHKPSHHESLQCDVGQKKFFCGRKGKFGLNCQAVSDAKGRFLEMSIRYGGSTSDCLAFEGSRLYQRLEDGLLIDGFCLFGDNAYINSAYMATPFKNVSSGSRDHYNYYHSQLRIRVECAFGMLTQRWSILRTPLPLGLSISRSIALVNALAKLHNFCIDCRDDTIATNPGDHHILLTNPHGYVNLEANDDNDAVLPVELIGGGHHFHDIDRSFRRNQGVRDLPRQRLHAIVANAHLIRPRPRGQSRTIL